MASGSLLENVEKHEKHENVVSTSGECNYSGRNIRMRLHKLNSPFVKHPMDLKTCLYNMCINFSYSDIYQEYVNRLSLNSYNNCDYDQIRRSYDISKKDFFKYYNFPFYNNCFELESDEGYVDIFSEDSDNSSNIDEIEKCVMEKYIHGKYNENANSKIKKLILYKSVYNKMNGFPFDNGQRGDATKRGFNIDGVTGEKGTDDTQFANSKSRTSQLLHVVSRRNVFNNGMDNIDIDRVLYAGSSNEMESGHVHREKNWFLKIVRRCLFLLQSWAKDSKEYSFMDSFNINSLKYDHVNKKKIKNSCNDDYFHMMHNLLEAQRDPFVEMYYRHFGRILEKRGLNSGKGGKRKTCEEIMHGQAKSEQQNGKNEKNEKNGHNGGKNQHKIERQNGKKRAQKHELTDDRTGEQKGMLQQSAGEASGEREKDDKGDTDNANTSKRKSEIGAKNMKRLCSEEVDICFKKALKNEVIDFNQDRIDGRDRWSSLCPFICSCVGASLSAHCYLDLPQIKSVFDFILLFMLIMFCYLFIGLPLLQMEYALGQISQSCVVNSLSFLKKKFRGVGIITLIVLFSVLLENINNSVNTAIIVASALRRPLPWNSHECEHVPYEGECIQDGRCAWIMRKGDSSTKNGINIEMDSSRRKEGCVSVGILEGVTFFSEQVHVMWKFFAILFITSVLCVLLRVEGMSLNKGLRYSFFLFLLVCLSQVFQLFYELGSYSSRGAHDGLDTHDHSSGYVSDSVFFGEKNLLYVNFPLMVKIFTIVLFSVKCATGINYMFSSFTTIGENVFVYAWYVVCGSFLGTSLHITYYYLCIALINRSPYDYERVSLQSLLQRLNILPIDYSSYKDFFSQKKVSINHQVIYVVALSRVKFANIITFSYFLSSVVILVTSSGVFLKGAVLILKEGRMFRKYKKEVITHFILMFYFFLGLFNLLPFGYNLNMLINYTVSNYIYLFVLCLQTVYVTWIYRSKRVQTEMNEKRIYHSYLSLIYFSTIFVIPLIVLLCKKILVNYYSLTLFLPLTLSLLLIFFICVNYILIYRIEGDISLKKKIYYLYLCNIDILREKLNDIFYGRRRSYDTNKKKYTCGSCFQKLPYSWCCLIKYLIPLLLLLLSVCNFVSSIYDLRTKRGHISTAFMGEDVSHTMEHITRHEGRQNAKHADGHIARHIHLRGERGDNMGTQNGWKSLYPIQAEKKTAKWSTTAESPAQLGRTFQGKDTVNPFTSKAEHSFGLLAQFILTSVLILLVLIISIVPFVNPRIMNMFTSPPTHTWSINDIHLKKKKPLNFLYTRHICFLEEIFPTETIMPYYVWCHMENHLNKDNFDSSLKRDNENNETVCDKSFTQMNRKEYESYILALLNRGIRLCDFAHVT
ncbi:amino acid transporter, putative [Plasmodium ovale]|uniref:Amino acid transporter, putative n=2 Tax=Plasmodium ovale TaxID=36330 RepID=A0A1A8WFK4_PLAOA|nr:amino acid transporter, putative [Plasmodium ovale curtisi]SBS91734.1 amino acid transporter, putative [Plasmodium ovale curtisi]SCP04652.1 amino acid transporter, putative [Plasmodium ovale]